MPNFKWSTSFETGHEEIDRQHREMVDDVVAIEGDLLSGQFEAANTKCRAVRNHLENHFRYEERFLKDHGFPRLAEHHESHVAARRKIEGIVAECKENCQTGLELGCIVRCYGVIFREVLITDLDFKSYLQEFSNVSGH